MDAMQILVVILSIFLAIFLALAIALTVMLMRVTKQINHIAESTKTTIDKVNSFATDMLYTEETPQSSGFTPGESEIQMQMTLIYEVL